MLSVLYSVRLRQSDCFSAEDVSRSEVLRLAEETFELERWHSERFELEELEDETFSVGETKFELGWHSETYELAEEKLELDGLEGWSSEKFVLRPADERW